MTQFQSTLPTVLHHQSVHCPPGTLVKVFAQDESRVGLLPLIRRRITACGVQPIATVTPTFQSFYLYGAVEPITGESFFLELPALNSEIFQLWLDYFAAAFPQTYNILVLDNGAFHKAHALHWPPNVAPVFLPPYSPELNPIERVWRDLKDRLADITPKTVEELSQTVCRLIQNYSRTALQSLTGYAYFVQAVRATLHTANG
jgi:putative transposase